MSRATRKGGKEVGKVLVQHKVIDCTVPAMKFTPLDCDKPAFRHLKGTGGKCYIPVGPSPKLERP